MFSSVSLPEYLIPVILFLIVYYGILLSAYLRTGNSSPHQDIHSSEANSKDTFREDEIVLLFSLAHDLKAELMGTFKLARIHKYQKEGLLMALQPKISKFKKLNGTALQISVDNHIIRESELIPVPIEENDLENMW